MEVQSPNKKDVAQRRTPWYQHKDPKIGKSQVLRIIDVFILGPAMIYVGTSGKVPKAWRKWATIGGVLTVLYNAQNYLRVGQSKDVK